MQQCYPTATSTNEMVKLHIQTTGLGEPQKQKARTKKMDLKTLRTPCYTLDKSIAKNNAETMLKRAESLGCTLRPHVKTHKTIEGALLQTGGRRSGIVVSTIREAEFFAENGFSDIIYAVPITPDKVPAAASLSTKTQFHVVVDNTQQLEAVLQHELNKKWSIFIMVDCGYHRDGIDPNSTAALELADAVERGGKATLTGLYTHGGHSYNAPTPDKIEDYSRQERDAVSLLAQKLKPKYPNLTVGVGSTPTCSRPPADGLSGVNEMHPGNYFTYDYNQCVIGSCTIEQVLYYVI
eukprot:TRINITY_DN2699_c2_g1_i2.p1 TRINITY_DN2699_c2_g1~~TRINITY_DN2699_c2_g1_i2.p1  ORF type:complete len:294 (+),score=49.40 TRINITY_DN2699_c2_g1_i2:3-884(+)